MKDSKEYTFIVSKAFIIKEHIKCVGSYLKGKKQDNFADYFNKLVIKITDIFNLEFNFEIVIFDFSIVVVKVNNQIVY